jgi:hypothetical protein
MTREENSFRAREMREAICRWLLFEILRSATFCGRELSAVHVDRIGRKTCLPKMK